MRNAKTIRAQAVAAAILCCGLGPAFGAVFTLMPSSTVNLSGNFSVDVGGISSGSGTLAAQGPGSLASILSGSINASAGGNTLSFTGGTITANSSGNWQPNGSPAAFGFQVIVPLSGPLSGDSFKFVGDIRDVQFSVTGNVGLSGAPGNQTFNTSGLALNTTSGTIDLQVFFCSPTCADQGTTSGDLSGPPADILPAGNGSFTRVGPNQRLSFPIALSDSQSQSDTVEGVKVTLATTLSLDGNIAAFAPIPEPSTWAMLSLGLIATLIALHNSKNIGRSRPLPIVE